MPHLHLATHLASPALVTPRYQWSSQASGLAAAIAAANGQADPGKQAQLLLSSTVMAGLAVRLMLGPQSSFALAQVQDSEVQHAAHTTRMHVSRKECGRC